MRSATFWEVNQASRRATSLSFYVPVLLFVAPISISFIRLILPCFNHSISMWLRHLRDLFACRSLCEKVLFEFHEFPLSPDFQTSHSETAAHKNTKQSKQTTTSPRMFTLCTCAANACGSAGDLVLRMGVARRCAKVVSMVIDVGSSPWRWIAGGVGRQGRPPRTRREWLQPHRQEIEEEHSKGGSRKKVQFHKPNYFWDGGEKNITAISAQGMRGEKERGGGGGAGGSRREEGGPKQKLSYKSLNMYSHISN